MPVSFRIIRDLGLVYVRYSGTANAAEGIDLFKAYMQHPDCRPGQKHLVDLSEVTEVDPDYPDIMRFQALKADHFAGPVPQTLIVYYAPSLHSQMLAEFAIRSWQGQNHLVARLFDTKEAALDFLGVGERELSVALSRAE